MDDSMTLGCKTDLLPSFNPKIPFQALADSHGKTMENPTSCQYLITLCKLPYSAVGPAPSPNNYNLTVFLIFGGQKGKTNTT